MSWASAVRKPKPAAAPKTAAPPDIRDVDWNKLVTVDFETYYDSDYTLSKLSTSEYVRDPRFLVQMVGIKIGGKKTRTFTGAAATTALKSIDWKTHSLLCHNTAFDGFILSHHYGIKPLYYYDTLSMARGLHSNEIGASLEDVSVFYGGEGKIKDVLESTAGVKKWSAALKKQVAAYCERDVDETHRIFCEMHPKFPTKEMDLVNLTVRMFCQPTLEVDIPRVQKEYEREVQKRKEVLLSAVPDLERFDTYNDKGKYTGVLEKKDGRDTLTGEDRMMAVAKKVVGSTNRFVALLTEVGVPDEELPRKISPAWMKLGKQEREERIEDKWAYALAKDDLDFVDLPERVFDLRPELDRNCPDDVAQAVDMQARLQALVTVRLAVKSTTNITRAARFLEAGKNGMKLPVGYSYYRAHTGRWGGNNKMNMQNLTRGGELRLSIKAARKRAIAVCDSGQIEARVNGWLWGQRELMDAFRKSDAYDAEVSAVPENLRREMRQDERDAYCRFADIVYGRVIWKKDKLERFIGKVCVLGLGFQMGAAKLQMTLAKGALGGPRVNFSLDMCKEIVNAYRQANYAIAQGWKTCNRIIEEMADGVHGSHSVHGKRAILRWGGDKEGNGWILLPNGMSLKYPRLRKARNDESGYEEWTYGAVDARKKIYGGLLCENIVQALARIIVAEQMLMVDKKYPVVMTTHDEVVAHPTLAQAQKCYDYMYECMTTPLDWCPDIPLAAEGGWAENYSK